MSRFLIVLAAIATLGFGCSTSRDFVPTIQSAPRPAFGLRSPVVIALLDGRTSSATQESPEPALRRDLDRIYGQAIRWQSYFAKPESGTVVVKVRILALGAEFGSRVLSSTTISQAISTAQAQATGPWGTVVVNASGQQSLLATTFSTQGWWVGSAWLEVSVTDNRRVPATSFSVPLAAEHAESNTWGYASATRASERAWNRVAPGLIAVLDDVLVTVRDSE